MSILSRINGPADVKTLTLPEMTQLAQEIRDEIVRVVYQTGGHLGSKLGVVELTIALHHVFDLEQGDALVWDVSHQIYPHKLLTGRHARFGTLRQFKGVSGFANPAESKHDPFLFGHAGTAASTALGMAQADHFLNRKRRVVAIVGDGSLTCGATYEALNHAGHLKRDLLFILNDNAMSIGKTIGALSTYLNRLRTAPAYEELKHELHQLVSRFPKIGEPVEHAFAKIVEPMKSLLGKPIFSALGWDYFGPIDGHNLEETIRILQRIKAHHGPVLLHLLTVKGKGYAPAEADPGCLHGIKPAAKPRVESEAMPPAVAAEPTKAPKVNRLFSPPSRDAWTKVFADIAIELAGKDPKVVAITAAMPDGTGLDRFEKVHPDRYFDVGICEQHGVAFCAGMVKAGMKPIAAIYSTFLQRGYDQVFQEIVVQQLPLLFCMDRGGLAGNDGPTHHGLHDLAYLRTFPGFILMAPKDVPEMRAMMEFGLRGLAPCAIRYPRDNAPDFAELNLPEKPVELGKAEVVRTGADGALIAYGYMVLPALQVAESLAADGIELTVVNARFAKPVDAALFRGLARQVPFLATFEDHSIHGGFGAAVLESLAGQEDASAKVHVFGVPDILVEHGTRPEQFKLCGLDPETLIDKIRRIALDARRTVKARTV